MGDCFTQIYDSKKIIGNIVNFLLENSDKIKTKIDYNLFFQPTQSVSSNSTVDDELLFKKNFSQYFPKEQKETNKATYKFLYKTLDDLLSLDNLKIENIINNDLQRELKAKFHFNYEMLTNNVVKERKSENFLFFPDISQNQIKESNEEEKEQNDNKKIEISKNLDTKIILLHLIYFQLLSEISYENKERAILLYKVTSFQFSLQVQILSMILKSYKEKIKALEEINESILKKHLNFISDLPFKSKISEALLDESVTENNLTNHKAIIRRLLSELQTQKQENFQQISQNNILKNELSLWLYEFDKMKLDPKLRKKMQELDKEKIASPLRYELTNQGVNENEILLLINSEIYLSLSEQKSFSVKQIEYYRNEISRLKKIAEDNYNKKIQNKKKWKNLYGEFELYKMKKEKEIEDLRNLHMISLKEEGTQTQVDMIKFNKYLRNNELIIGYKRLKHTKLSDLIESIKFNSIRAVALSKESLLSLIPEILNQKRVFELENSESEAIIYDQFDEFFFNFMKSKFKLRKVTNKHCAEFILALFRYSKEDKRVDLFRRFLCVGNNPIKSEAVNIILVILQNLPITLYKLYNNETNFEAFYLSTEMCFEIYHTKLKFLNLVSQNKSALFINTKVFDEKAKNKKKSQVLITEIKKADLFFFSRMFKKSLVFMSDLKYELKNKNKEYEDLKLLTSRFSFDNQEFQFTDLEILDLFNRNLKIVDKKVYLPSLFDLFDLKYKFQISLIDFIEITNIRLSYLFDKLEEQAVIVFRDADINGKKYFEVKDFEIAVRKMIPRPLDKSQIIELFCKAGKSTEKDYITKEEWIYFCLNYKDIYIPFFEKYNY